MSDTPNQLNLDDQALVIVFGGLRTKQYDGEPTITVTPVKVFSHGRQIGAISSLDFRATSEANGVPLVRFEFAKGIDPSTLPEALTQAIEAQVQQIKKVIPWAECTSPMDK